MNKDLKEKFAFTLAEGATHVDTCHNHCKSAFTLAEVLITLGIIGIVSAMTIPTLIKNYQEKMRDNQFKKAYATLNQALRMTTANFDYVPKCYFTPTGLGLKTECDIFWENFSKNLKVVKHCPDKAFEGGCIPHYDGLDVVYKDNHKNDTDYDEEYWLNHVRSYVGYSTSTLKNNCPSYVLNDGSILLIYNNHVRNSADFAIDINGHQGKNKFGHDLFIFMIVYDGSKFYIASSDTEVAENGLTSYQMLDRLFGSKVKR